MTTEGFFSAVEDRDDNDAVLVRARVRADADRLADAIGAAVSVTPDADYRFRVRTSKTAWAEYLRSCAQAIDYDNFKNAVAERQGWSRAEVYGKVWALLLRLQSRREDDAREA